MIKNIDSTSQINPPVYVSVIACSLGVMDLLRGLLHTVFLAHAAGPVAGLDLTTQQAADLLLLMGVFGISNLLTGAMLIMMSLKARHLALPMLALIPAAYVLGGLPVQKVIQHYPPTLAAFPGKQMMAVYLTVSMSTFLIATISMRLQRISIARLSKADRLHDGLNDIHTSSVPDAPLR